MTILVIFKMVLQLRKYYFANFIYTILKYYLIPSKWIFFGFLWPSYEDLKLDIGETGANRLIFQFRIFTDEIFTEFLQKTYILKNEFYISYYIYFTT